MCRSRLWLLYWVSTQMRRNPPLTRLDRAKSMSRYSPPNGTAGLARSAVSGARRLPAPPASTMPRIRGSSCMGHSPQGAPRRAALPSDLARRLYRASYPDLGLVMREKLPVRHEGGRQAVPAGQAGEGLGAVVEVLPQDLVLRAVGPVEGEVEEPAGHHDPPDVGQALVDHGQRGMREHAVRVHDVE